ncbi:hypothetical protein [Flavobacterium sp.]|uniref:hypothetical protein n=1 Tax=Flavobacterium sp. TaxID=239 RepID=UPI003D6A15DF
MDLLDYPNRENWQKRRDWLDTELENAQTGFSYLVSDHSIALFIDMEIAFCSGAWISVVIMSVSVIDAHLRETEAMDNKIGTAKLLSEYYEGEDIDWLRQLRNKYVHHNLDKPIFEINDWYSNQEQLELEATKAILMTIKAIFQSPGT